jgi:hypothetical protein
MIPTAAPTDPEGIGKKHIAGKQDAATPKKTPCAIGSRFSMRCPWDLAINSASLAIPIPRCRAQPTEHSEF